MLGIKSTLCGFSFPLFPLALVGIELSEVMDYIRGNEFRRFLAEFLIQVTTGVVDAVIIGALTLLFGT